MVRGPPMFGMRRREFITLLGGAVAAWPLAARAQQPAMPVIGFMSTRSPEDSAYLLAAFRRGLAEGGFVEGQNVAIEFRWARGRYDLLSAMAAELVSRRVAVLTTAGGEPSALAAKRATSTIPMVFGIGGDPVALGVVESFSRPGGNATGVTLLTSLMEPKRLGLLRDLVPGVPLIGVLLNPEFAPASHYLQEVEEAARSIDQRILIANASTDEELETAFAALISAHVGALLVTADPYFDTRREQIVAFCGPAAPALHLPVSRIRGRGRIAELWREHHRCLSQLRRLYREDSQRRKTRRSTGAAADQVRDGNQSQDRRGARHQNLRQSTLARRRGDRIGPCCDCSQPLMALLGPREMSDLSPHSGAKRTLTPWGAGATGHPRGVSCARSARRGAAGKFEKCRSFRAAERSNCNAPCPRSKITTHPNCMIEAGCAWSTAKGVVSRQVIERRLGSPRYDRAVIIFGAACDFAVIIKLEHRACPTTERQGGGSHFAPGEVRAGESPFTDYPHDHGSIGHIDALRDHAKIRDGIPPFFVMRANCLSSALHDPERRIDIFSVE